MAVRKSETMLLGRQVTHDRSGSAGRGDAGMVSEAKLKDTKVSQAVVLSTSQKIPHTLIRLLGGVTRADPR